MRGKDAFRQQIKVVKYIKKLFIGDLINVGNIQKAQKIFYAAINKLKKKVDFEPFSFLSLAVKRASPYIRLRNKRFGALIHKLPYFLPPTKAKSYAIRWMIEGAIANNTNDLGQSLADEIYNCFKRVGYATKKRNEIHKTALANRVYMKTYYKNDYKKRVVKDSQAEILDFVRYQTRKIKRKLRLAKKKEQMKEKDNEVK